MNTMITDAAVEAGASAISARHLSNTGVPFPIKACRDDARVALEAALPHLATVKKSLTVAPSVDAWAVADIVRSDLDRQSCPDAYMRIAVESVVKHLTATPEAGNPVSVSERERFEAGIGVGSRVSVDGHNATVTGLDPYTERFKIEWDAPKGGTMYRLREEMCPIAARQPVDCHVAVAGSMPGTIGFTAAIFKAEDVPLGTKIYAAPPQQPAQVEWQPIETAPKTGRSLLLGHFNSAGNWRTLRGRWFTKAQIEYEWENGDDFEEGWFEESVEADDIPNVWATTPTHWMPLPAAPVIDSQGANK